MTAFGIFDLKSKDEFEQKVTNNKSPIVLEYHAKWCESCKKLSQQIQEVYEKQFKDKMLILKLDIDELSEIAKSKEVTSIPRVILYNNGKEIDSFVGVQDDDELISRLKKIL